MKQDSSSENDLENSSVLDYYTDTFIKSDHQSSDSDRNEPPRKLLKRKVSKKFPNIARQSSGSKGTTEDNSHEPVPSSSNHNGQPSAKP